MKSILLAVALTPALLASAEELKPFAPTPFQLSPAPLQHSAPAGERPHFPLGPVRVDYSSAVRATPERPIQLLDAPGSEYRRQQRLNKPLEHLAQRLRGA